MRTLFLLLSALLAPLAVAAQPYSNAPMVIVGEGAPPPAATPPRDPAAAFPNFPEVAITRVGEATTGQHVEPPATPASPATPAALPPASAPVAPGNPASPPVPKSPVSKLWPRDTLEIFLPPCTGLRPQFVAPCTCVISRLMLAMPHDEFLAKSETNTIEQDPRLIRIRRDCATAPKKKD
ncbi:MAG: hypothetical protein SFW64_01520 [Alphaproteobacteria bacterium]|nr:hypothetical protein [Alphaproteobacteria bacterium]